MKKAQLSGKFVLRIPPDLHEELKEQAFQQSKSLNQVCVERLTGSHQPANKFVSSFSEFLGDQLVAIYQFGSSVRGQATSSSDIDTLCIVSPETKINRELYRKWDDFSERQNIDSKISVHFVHSLANPTEASSLWLEVALEGVPLFDPHFEIQKILINLRQQILDKQYQRIIVHGQPVWSKNLEDQHA